MRTLAFLPRSLLCALLCLQAACDEPSTESQSREPELPPVSAMELPVSHRSHDSAPHSAVAVSLSPVGIFVNGAKVVDLHRGRLAATEHEGASIPALNQVLAGLRSPTAASLRVQLQVPFRTLTYVMNAIHAAGIHQAFFQVRPGAGAETGWFEAKNFRVGAPGEEAVAFDGPSQRQWNEFASTWEDVYSGCRRADYVACDAKPDVIAEGGMLELRSWARGSAVRIEFDRFDAADPEAHAGHTGPVLLPGVPPPRAAEPDEEEVPPDTHGTFTWRFRAATAELSAITDAMRPLCGSKACSMVVSSDFDAPSMRILSLLGAAFPDGTPSPSLYFATEE